MFLKSLSIILFCSFPLALFSQSAGVTNYINEITGIIKKHSMVAGQIDWDKYEKDLRQLSRDINDPDSCKPLQQYIIQTLRQHGDKHSFFINKSVTQTLNSASPTPQRVQARLLGTHTGYVKVPGMMSFNTMVNDAFKDTIQQLIKKLDTENDITGWIVDLRQNTGGNMWPMLGGLNALIKDGIAGYWIFPGNKKVKWYSSGRSMVGTGRFYKIKKLSSPIAVLIDSFTASSGEMTAISFLGLRNVKTFGQPSAGYTTANNSYPLSNGSMLALAISYAADRKKKVYKDKIIPDVVIAENTAADATIEAAGNWLAHYFD